EAARYGSCADALPIGEQGRVTMNLSDARPEVWLRYRADREGLAIATSVGSDLDTTVDVYSACPSPDGPAPAHFDDEVGLQAQATFAIHPGVERWIRVAGWRGATGYASLTLVGSSSGIAGRITRE